MRCCEFIQHRLNVGESLDPLSDIQAVLDEFRGSNSKQDTFEARADPREHELPPLFWANDRRFAAVMKRHGEHPRMPYRAFSRLPLAQATGWFLAEWLHATSEYVNFSRGKEHEVGFC